MIGPVDSPTVSGNEGYTYRNNVLYPSNLDRVEVIQSHRQINLNGIHYDNSAVKIAGSQLEAVEDRFWPDGYVMLHEMAQYRDGYKSTTGTLTVPNIMKYRDAAILTVKINARVLWALFHCTLYNEGMKTMIPGFQTLRRRMLNLLLWTNQLIYPQEWDSFIQYWSTVFTPYPGGPVCYNLFAPKALQIDDAATANFGHNSKTFTAWANANRPDLTLVADVTAFIADQELILEVIDRYDNSVAANVTDLKLLTSLYKMMSYPTPQTPVSGLQVNPTMFIEQFKQGAISFRDNKGAGADTFVCSDDISGDVEGLIDLPDVGAPYSPEYLTGFRNTYAFDLQDSATKGYCAETEKIAALGVVRHSELGGKENVQYSHIERLYTQEDGWYEPVTELDFTAAAGLQAWLWSLPHVTINPKAWEVIRSEEAEEDYHTAFGSVGNNGFQMPWDHIGLSYRKFLHNAYKIPWIS
jgi:hypothetical protein